MATFAAVIFEVVWGSMYQSLGLLLCNAGDDSQCCESFFVLINLCDGKQWAIIRHGIKNPLRFLYIDVHSQTLKKKFKFIFCLSFVRRVLLQMISRCLA